MKPILVRCPIFVLSIRFDIFTLQHFKRIHPSTSPNYSKYTQFWNMNHIPKSKFWNKDSSHIHFIMILQWFHTENTRKKRFTSVFYIGLLAKKRPHPSVHLNNSKSWKDWHLIIISTNRKLNGLFIHIDFITINKV